MTGEIVLLLQADADIQQAFDGYENYQDGRGEIFLHQLDLAFGLLKQFPEIGPGFHRQYRRLLVGEFPYGIFYTIEGERIIVIRVQHLRQDIEAIIAKLPS